MFEFLLLHRLLLLTVVTSVSAVANCSILLCIIFEEIAFYHIVPIFSTEWLCINCSVSLVHVFEYEMHRFDRKKHIERKPNSIWERLKLHACNRQNGKTFASYFFLCSMHANRWYFFDFLAYFRWLFLHWNEQIKNFTHSFYSYIAEKSCFKTAKQWLGVQRAMCIEQNIEMSEMNLIV